MNIETMDEATAAAALGIPQKSLANLRRLGRIGHYRVTPRHARYSPAHLAAYLAAAEHPATSGPAKLAGGGRKRFRLVDESTDPGGLRKAMEILAAARIDAGNDPD